jgi:3-oxoacyl-[acyl-carrier protein] reductase
MNLRLDGKRALVTGSGGGISAAIARLLAREGVAVVVHGLGEEKAAGVVQCPSGALTSLSTMPGRT